MVEVFPNFITREQIESVLALKDSWAPGDHRVALPTEIRELIGGQGELTPMRYILGDTPIHKDTSAIKKRFINTFILYLNDSPGSLVIDGVPNSIVAGTAYRFNEGLEHYTEGAGPRLLIGPMDEEGSAVGLSSLNVDGSTDTIHIKQEDGQIYYYLGNVIPPLVGTPTETMDSWPYIINNTSLDPTVVLKVRFINNITLTSSNQYFFCGTSRIQFGYQELRPTGFGATITIDGVSNYPGLIQTPPDLDSISAFNLSIHSTNGSTLAADGGWIGQNGFAENGTNFLIVNCHSDGDISENGGGIIGANAFKITSSANFGDKIPSLKIIGCSSEGDIGTKAGGIIGKDAASKDLGATLNSTYELSIIGCWSEGSILGQYSGGIIGCDAGDGNVNTVNYIRIETRDCYSTGEISGIESGGIFGSGAFKCVARNCYSLGAIGSDAGGIFGSNAINSTAENCYSTGSVSSGIGGGIFGYASGNETSLDAVNCYTSGINSYIYVGVSSIPSTCYSEAANGSSGWNTAHASTALRYVFPDQQPVWIEIGSNQPFELFRLGYTPYIRGIFDSDAKKFVTNNQLTRNAGETTPPALITEGREYSLVGDSHGITINPATGAITIPSDTPDNDYTLFVRYTGSYYYSTVSLIVGLGAPAPAPSCCPSSTELKGLEFAVRTNVKEGVLIRQGPSFGPLAYSDLMKIRKANAFVR
jgi:hypothetical protein